ncbi:MAG TPA: hypothetical protein VET48_01855, partial [Steroidobacteraceae bacterium]|nr:hypothetical protein [Steroidobacteraceae bacterium]
PEEEKQLGRFSKASSSASVAQRYAPGTVVQVGPGLPSWSFNSYPYSWNGPVDASESLRFIIATPFWMFLWRVLGVVLLGAVIVEVARMSFSLTAARNFMQPFTKNASLVIALLVAAIAAPYGAKADTPSDELLTELKARLTQPPKCSPNCAEVMCAQVSASADKLDMTLDVAALANVAVAVPAAVGRWEPESLAVDGQSAGAVYRDPQLRYWVALKSGAHSIRLSGRLAAAESIQIVFPQIPKVIATGGSGWEFSGVNEDRLLTNTLELVRVRTGSTADKLFASAQFAPFVRVRRFVQFDLDWTMITTVERIAPDKGAFTIEVPLLKDESVLTAGMTLREKNGARLVLVGLTAGQNQFSWNSALPHAEAMELTMPESADRTEHWRFLVSPIWNVQFKGVLQVAPENVNATPWTFDYFPRANETLSLAVYRPDAVAGQTLAIDDVFIASNVGPRSTDTALQLKVRSTQGGRHTITLPKDANVSSVTVDEIAVPVRPQDGELPISLLPGAHRLAINWQSDAGASFRTTSADVSLQAPASNIRTRITLGGERWVLFARGAGVGPAILYWGELLVFIAIALLLGRYTESPLKTRDWLLLGLGLSTFSWSVLLLFAIWIFAMRWRGGMTEPSSAVRFNLLQLALGVLTVISVGALVSAIPTGLLSEPDMSMHSSTDGYLWFVDQSTSKLPDAALYSVPLVVYKIAILLWALWLSFALLRWLPWAWRAFSHNGIWRSSNFQQIVKGE